MASTLNSDSNKTSIQVRLNMDGGIRQKFTAGLYFLNPAHDLVCSPLSTLLLLGKIGFGATGNCSEQIQKAIGVNDMFTAMDTLRTLGREMDNLGTVRFRDASKIFISDTFHLNDDYLDTVKNVFSRGVRMSDMRDKYVLAQTINSWVFEHTDYKIPKLFESSDFSISTKMVMVSVVYFQGQWEKPFNPNSKKQPFHSPRGEVQVPMMKLRTLMKYSSSDDLDAQIVTMYYRGGLAALTVILPSSRIGINKLVNKIKGDPELLNKALAKLADNVVDISMPKFKIDLRLDLKNIYEKLGMLEMFDHKDACLNEITDDEDLRISMAIQKAIIIVDENGTETNLMESDENKEKYEDMDPAAIYMNIAHPFYYTVTLVLGNVHEQLLAGVCTF